MLGTDHERLPLTRFIELTRNYHADLRNQEPGLQTACDIFATGQQIWPDECDEVLKSLSDLQTILRRFHDWLDDSTILPSGAVPLSLLPLAKLRDADTHTTKAIHLIRQFQERSWVRGRRGVQQQAEIARILEVIEQRIADLAELVQHLLDAARFPARSSRLDSISVSRADITPKPIGHCSVPSLIQQ